MKTTHSHQKVDPRFYFEGFFIKNKIYYLYIILLFFLKIFFEAVNQIFFIKVTECLEIMSNFHSNFPCVLKERIGFFLEFKKIWSIPIQWKTYPIVQVLLLAAIEAAYPHYFDNFPSQYRQ